MIRGELAQQVEELTAERAPFVQATVVRAQSPTSVRPGDTAIVRRDGTIDGFVGGTCAETSVRLHALRALCDRALWLDRGRIRADGLTPDVIAAYQSDIGVHS